MLASANLGLLDFCEKLMPRHYSVSDSPILMKFGRLMQNNIPIMKMWSTSKPEVEFKNGGRKFFQSGSSYISAQPWIELS